jgi:outer membrane lipoprotein-sorting protein
MRKPFMLLLMAFLVMSIGLAGCGKRTAENVLKDLQGIQGSLKSYQSKAMMEVQTPSSTTKYYIETWYQKPDLYRIALGDEKRQINQVIVRNEEGIFVVNPQLKKSFRFRGDWAENQGGHVYLYHALIDRILKSQDKKLSMKDGQVVIEMAMVPENPVVTKQQIFLDDRKLHPKQMVLFNKEEQPVVTVNYEFFDTGMSFKKDVFTPEAAMALAADNGAVSVTAGKTDFGVIEPGYLPKGMNLKEIKEHEGAMYLMYNDDKGKAVTIVERRPAPGTVPLPIDTTIRDLYGTPAVVTGAGDVKTMYWTHRGVEFSMTASLPVTEMMKIAQSTMGSVGK